MTANLNQNSKRKCLKDLNENEFNDLQILYRDYNYKKQSLEDALKINDDEFFYLDLVGDTTWGVVKTHIITELRRQFDELEKRINNTFIEDLN